MNVGVIGAGQISEIYLKNMTQRFDNLTVIAIAANHLENAKKKADKYGIQACTVEELLANPQVELVVNLTPVGAHYQLIKAALLAGKHVYTEKTITANLAEAEELVNLANEKGLYLGSAPDTFLGGALQSARQAIDSGILGEIHSFAISANRNNDLLLSFVAFLREPGAGILNDYGVYYMTALVSILGPVAKVGGIIGRPYLQHRNIMPQDPLFGQMMDTPNESQVSAVVQLENGVTGTFHMDADSVLADQAYFAVYGTKGILYLTDPNQFGGEVKFLANALDPRVPNPPVTLWHFSPFDDDSRGVGPSEMAKAIQNKEANPVSKEMAYHVLEVLTRIYDGGEKGQFYDIASTCQRPKPLPIHPVPITNVGHASFQMKNEEAMLHFYQDVLGMQRAFTIDMGELLKFAQKMQQEQGDNLPQDMDEEQGRAILAKMQENANKPWITYMKLADHQFLELFHDLGRSNQHKEDVRDYYGYSKLNYEVDSIQEMRDRIVNAGYELKDDIHPTLDGSMEITVIDPDGNEVQFTEYGPEGKALVPLDRTSQRVLEHKTCSPMKYTTQLAFQVQDAINMENFYCQGLGLKKVMTLTFADLCQAMEQNPQASPEMLMGLRMMGDKPWIDYIEIAPHQYLELFHVPGEVKKEERDLSSYDGFQHICLEVSDIHQAWQAVTANGVKPDTQISLGADGAYQFWLVDPDGNRLELMEYAQDALQLQ